MKGNEVLEQYAIAYRHRLHSTPANWNISEIVAIFNCISSFAHVHSINQISDVRCVQYIVIGIYICCILSLVVFDPIAYCVLFTHLICNNLSILWCKTIAIQLIKLVCKLKIRVVLWGIYQEYCYVLDALRVSLTQWVCLSTNIDQCWFISMEDIHSIVMWISACRPR